MNTSISTTVKNDHKLNAKFATITFNCINAFVIRSNIFALIALNHSTPGKNAKR